MKLTTALVDELDELIPELCDSADAVINAAQEWRDAREEHDRETASDAREDFDANIDELRELVARAAVALKVEVPA